MNNIVELEHTVKTYQMGSEEIRAVDGIDLSVRQGEFVSLAGSSGSGKSTLLHLIGCVDRATSGTIKIDAVDTATLKETELAELRSRKIGFVFQQFFLLPTLTAWENVLLPAVFSRDERASKKERRAQELLDLVGLGDRADHLPSQLSGGQMQRVAIARALINDPKMFLADEPTGNLDSRNAEAVFDIFRELHRKGLTIIVVTHNEELAVKTSRRIHMRDGRIIDGAV